MKYVNQLPNTEELKAEFSLSTKQCEERQLAVEEIQRVLTGVSEKKLVIAGPCSADNETAVLDYMCRLAGLQEKIRERIVLVPRVYTGKPRTDGCGYKGILHRPDAFSTEDNLTAGIIAVRKLHLRIIRETGFFCADEMLYPDATCYVDDLLAYVAVGARSVENQQHRLVASGLEIPVGMKNPTSGEFTVMLNAIHAAQSGQSMIYHGYECRSEGNPYCHAILRGYISAAGKSKPNYHYDDLTELHDLYVRNGLKNPGVIIDCNHCNSNKKYDEQIRISREVVDMCAQHAPLNRFVKGLMLESYLVDGAQMIGEGIYGKSITDPCLGWSKTERLLLELADKTG